MDICANSHRCFRRLRLWSSPHLGLAEVYRADDSNTDLTKNEH